MIGRKFKINSLDNTNVLCEGVLINYLGNKDNLDYFEAEITITFNPNNF